MDKIKYLNKNVEAAKKLVPLLARNEIAANIAAQNEFAGPKDMEEIGFAPAIVRLTLKNDEKTKQEIRQIGARLGWKTGRSHLPSMAWLSKEVGHERDYKFLYQGTSRFVHFSTAEIF
jgi:hypothetical protein